MVGLEEAQYAVAENEGKAAVCVVVNNRPTDGTCLVNFSFDINLSIIPDTAGN